MDNKLYIGIDNGLGGAISVIDYDNRIRTFDMPVLDIIKNKKKRSQYDESALRDIFLLFEGKPAIAFIEEVRYMPGQSSQSSGSIGYGFGLMVGLMTAFEIPFQKVSVRDWQKHFQIYGKGKETKNQSYRVASKLFPQNIFKTERGRILDGRSDATLISEYAKRISNI